MLQGMLGQKDSRRKKLAEKVTAQEKTHSDVTTRLHEIADYECMNIQAQQ